MERCECEILRILTGSIIRQMLSGGIEPKILWTENDAPDSVARFPVTPQQTTQWIKDFQKYRQDLLKSNLSPTKSVSCLMQTVSKLTIV